MDLPISHSPNAITQAHLRHRVMFRRTFHWLKQDVWPRPKSVRCGKYFAHIILQTHIIEDIDQEFNTVKKIMNNDSKNFPRSLLLVWLKHNDMGRDTAGCSYNLFTLLLLLLLSRFSRVRLCATP